LALPPQRQHLLAGARAEGDAMRTRGGLQRPEHAGVVRVGIVVSHVGRAQLFDKKAAPGEQLHRAGDDLVQQRLQRFIGRRGRLCEGRLAVAAASVYAVQHRAVQVDVEREPL
jgi:hypothetical protein